MVNLQRLLFLGASLAAMAATSVHAQDAQPQAPGSAANTEVR